MKSRKLVHARISSRDKLLRTLCGATKGQSTIEIRKVTCPRCKAVVGQKLETKQ